MTEERFEKLLDVYSVEDILEMMGLEVVEALMILSEQGYEVTTPEPL